jgi:hypothetical protein
MIVVNFEVIARPHETLPQRVPDPDGMRLWRMLHESHLGRVSIVYNGNVEADAFEHWLKLYGVKAAVYHMLEADTPVAKAEKIRLLMSATSRVDWYVDNDPATLAETLKLGIPSLAMLPPYIVRPEWVGDQQRRGWDELVSEVERQALLRTEKTWGEYE